MKKKTYTKALAEFLAQGLIEYSTARIAAGESPDPIAIKRYVYEFQRAEAAINFDLANHDTVLSDFDHLTRFFIRNEILSYLA